MALLNVEVGTEVSSGKIANIEQIIMAINALSKVLILICKFLLHLFFHFLLVTSFLTWTSNFSSFFANEILGEWGNFLPVELLHEMLFFASLILEHCE